MAMDTIDGLGQSSAAAVADAAGASRQVADGATKQAEAPAKASRGSPPVPGEEQLKEVAKRINDFIESNSTDLQFSVDRNTHRVVIKVKVKGTGEVVRQIPPAEAMQTASMLDAGDGVIIRKDV